jgi:hypothetical protein
MEFFMSHESLKDRQCEKALRSQDYCVPQPVVTEEYVIMMKL